MRSEKSKSDSSQITQILRRLTYDAVLHTEAQLKLGIWPSDDCHGDWWAVDNAELHILLVF